MCGIAGFSGDLGLDLLTRMNGKISHRGPDDSGVCHLPANGIGLAHRRLSIIDLSPSGSQPMWDVTKRAAIVFNGEIYNYRETAPGTRGRWFWIQEFIGYRSVTESIPSRWGGDAFQAQ